MSTYQTNTKDQTKNLTTCVVPQTTTKECNICNKKESVSPKVLFTHNLHKSMMVVVFVKQMLVKTRIKVNLRMKSEMTLNIKMYSVARCLQKNSLGCLQEAVWTTLR